MTNTTELRAKDQSALLAQLDTLHKEQFKLNMKHGSGQLNNTHEIRNVRRDIARINTILSEKKRSEA
jgi:large subunit ribosomal protein L29